MASQRIAVVGTLILAVITCANAFPESSQVNRQARQDEDEGPASSGINFGAQVAQIIAGAFTGNIDSIIKGSFGFIEDPAVNKLSHNTWETLKGNPTERPPWAKSTTVKSEPEPPAAPAVTQPPPPPAPPAAAAAEAPSPPKVETASSQSQSAPESVYAPDVYYPGSPFYPTKSPVRTTQPTYATLAPLSVVEGTATEREESSTPRTTTEEDDDGDEAEGFFSSEFKV